MKTAALLVLWVVVTAPVAAAGLEQDEPPEPSGTIRGRVIGAGEQPLAAATVFIEPPGREILTDADGGFEITDLALGGYRLQARVPGYAIETLESVVVDANRATEVDFQLSPLPVPLDQIVVMAQYSLLRDEPLTVVGLDREEIMELPHFGDDLYRAVSILPGTSSKDFSARFNVRGGLHDEVLVRLDGLELFEPFHLKDFDGVFGVIDPQVIGAVDLIPGSYPAEYGGRMSGVLDLRSARPLASRVNLGVSFSNMWAGGAGSFAGEKGSWSGSARRGYLDLVLSFVGEDQGRDGNDDEFKPRYWDAFAKMNYDLSQSQSLSLTALVADDTMTIDELDGAEKTDARTGYGNATLGLDHLAILGQKTVVETVLSASRVDRNRWVSWSEYDEYFGLVDDRVLDVLGVNQEWDLQVSDRQYLRTGFELRSFDAHYDYSNEIEDENYIDDPRFPPPSRSARYLGDVDGEEYSLWAAGRLRLGHHLTAELGARYDEQTHLDDSQVSPRLNLVWELGRESVLRAGWGHFYQPQRPHELAVEFSETEFYPAQRAEHLNLGFEKRWNNGYSLRLDLYRRDVRDPLPRYETLFNPFNPIAESEPDVIRVAAERALAEGLEVYLRAPTRGKLDWWLSYTLSSVDDEIGGQRQPRYLDQTHALTANANYRIGEKWNLNWVWLYHTGWPATEVSAAWSQAERRLVYDIGPFYAERWPSYHRLDLRASRTRRVGKSRLTFFVDVQNLYDRDNVRGIEIDDWSWVEQGDGSYAPVFLEESWFGIMPSFGVGWER